MVDLFSFVSLPKIQCGNNGLVVKARFGFRITDLQDFTGKIIM